MKKVLSIILSAVILAGLCVIPVYANTVGNSLGYNEHAIPRGDHRAIGPDSEESLAIMRERNALNNSVLEVEDYMYLCFDLVEKYYHYNESGEMDWLFFTCQNYLAADCIVQSIYYDRYIFLSDWGAVFGFGCGVYDIEEECFYSLEYAAEIEKYDADLDKALAAADVGRLMGDVTHDNVVNIKDATYIQKVLANLAEPDPRDYGGSSPYDFQRKKEYRLSCGPYDMNRDRHRDINDVTAVQKYIAKLDYLA